MLTIYKASAGSGKTFTLAREYILLLLGIKKIESDEGSDMIVPGSAPRPYRLNLMPGDNTRLIENNRHRSILAITFTRKATEEMKDRIIKELRKLSKNPAESKYTDDLIRDLHCSESDLAACSKLALKQLLFDYQNFNVSTIDSFFQRVLHTFARELDIQNNYNIEINDKEAMKAAVGEMLDHFNASASGDTPIEDWLYDFLSDKVEEGLDSSFLNRQSKMHESLVKNLAEIGSEHFKPYFEATKEYLSRADKPLAEFRKTLAKDMVKTQSAIENLAKDTFGTDGIPPEWLAVKSAVQIVENLLNKKKVGYSAVTGTKYLNDMANGSCEKPFTKAVIEYAGIGDADKAMSFFAELQRLTARREYIKCLYNSCSEMGLLSYAWPILDMCSKDNNTLLLSDTNFLLKSVIGSTDTPFVYERMGMRLKHFLIDEFQDTSKMQWEILRPLVGTDIEMQDSLVIGDEKQSIYRFRNSDSDILHSQVQDNFRGYCVTTGHEPARNTNYRSSADVIRFNNTLFAILANQLGVSGFSNVVQSIRPSNLEYKGMVKCKPLIDKESAFEEMANEIMRQIYTSGYKQKDIAILVNTNDEARAVVEYLIANHSDKINVASDEALLVASSIAVQSVISVLKTIDQATLAPDGDNEASSRYLTRSQVINRINRLHYFLGKEEDMEADKDMFATRAVIRAMSDDSAAESTIDSAMAFKPDSLPALVEAVIHSSFTSDEKHRYGAYLCGLLDAVNKYCISGAPSLHGFLDWWDASSGNLTLGSDNRADAVKVMTMHKSKGLEFYCVHIPLCRWSLGIHKPPQVWATISDDFIQSLYPSKTLDEAKALVPPTMYVKLDSVFAREDSPFAYKYANECADAVTDALNKTYVAFTRAKSELCVWYKPVKQAGKAIGYHLSNAFKTGKPEGAYSDLMVDLSQIFDKKSMELQHGAPTSAAISYEFNNETATKEEKEEIVPHYVYPRSGNDLLMGVDTKRELERDIDDKPEPQAPADNSVDPEAMDLLTDGINLHAIMAKVIRPSDADRALRLMRGRIDIDSDMAKTYANVIDGMLSMQEPEIKRWFEDFEQVIVESPIFIRSIDMTKRPDRVVICPDGTVDIIDYKFTTNPKHVGMKIHVDQVKRYASLLRELGHERVRAYLIYPRLKRILEVES